MDAIASAERKDKDKDESRPGFGLGYVANLIDATCFLAIATAALYFWGYIYFAGFTEALGVSYHGVSLPLQEYVTASWTGVLYLFLLIGGGSWVLWVLDRGLQGLGFFKKTDAHRAKPARKTYQEVLRFGLVIFGVGIVLLVGAIIMLFQGKQDAARVQSAKREIIIRTEDGKQVEGRFIYLRDFGGRLLVREMSPDLKTVVGSRWLKEGSYSSYTLLEAEREAESSRR